jgi:hypothetical protein
VSETGLSLRYWEKFAAADANRDRIVKCILPLPPPFAISLLAMIEVDVFERSGKSIRGDIEDNAVPCDVGFGNSR